jgi:hypothetical protein
MTNILVRRGFYPGIIEKALVLNLHLRVYKPGRSGGKKTVRNRMTG